MPAPASSARDLPRGHDQGLGCGLPLLEVLLGLRQLHDVVGSFPQRRELATAGQVDWIFKFGGTSLGHHVNKERSLWKVMAASALVLAS